MSKDFFDNSDAPDWDYPGNGVEEPETFAHEVECVHETDKALRIKWGGIFSGNGAWIPKAAVHDDSDVWKKGDKGKLVAFAWFVESCSWWK